jgi:23S rRNA pseudouridine2605 synthase
VSLLPEAHRRYLVLNKPAGFVSTMADEQGRPTASSLIAGKYRERLYNVGRLDMWSEGLLLFTNDGDFARTLAHPATAPEKEYLVETNGPIPADLPSRFAHGIRINGVWYKAEAAVLRDPRRLSVTLIEGKNREIRTVFAHYGAVIRRLTRTRIGPVTLGGLAPGESRPLTAEERLAMANNPIDDDVNR